MTKKFKTTDESTPPTLCLLSRENCHPPRPPKKHDSCYLHRKVTLGKKQVTPRHFRRTWGQKKKERNEYKKKREKKMILQTCDHRNGRGQGTNFSNVYDDVSALFFLSFGRCLKATPTDGSTKTASSSSSSVAILGEADVSTATIHFQVSQVSRSEASALIHHVVRMYESKIKTGDKQ